MPLPVIGILGTIATAAGTYGARALFFKGFVYVITYLMVPVVVYGIVRVLAYAFLESRLTILQEVLSSHDAPSLGMQLTGLTGWVAYEMRFPECLALVCTTLTTLLSLKVIVGVLKR